MHNVLIIGSGLAALTCAARLEELGEKNIAVCAPSWGGSPYIAAINFVLPDNPYQDSSDIYAQDMLKAGYMEGDRALVEEMAARDLEGYALLCRWGVEFARNADGSTKLRHVSGHTYPRSLCCTTRLIGEEIRDALLPKLRDAGVIFYEGRRAVRLLRKDGRICGATVVDKDGRAENLYAPSVVAAWGGVGHLFGASTYPDDIRGDTLGVAHFAGADLVDIEFFEFEPMVVQSPPGAVGEPCPTAMLGEGAYLRNSEGERFLLAVRPQGEKGAPKTLINREIWKQVKAGKGSPRSGVYADMRHIPRETLQGYPWFYNRLMQNGCDPCEQLVEVGPMPHSISGGIRVDGGYRSNVPGLYAAGEACGGVHGACRCAGNAASQAVMSGLLCAEAVAKDTAVFDEQPELPVSYAKDSSVYDRYVSAGRQAASAAMGIYRNGDELEAALAELTRLEAEPDLTLDTDAVNTLCAMRLMVTAALNRKESRGVHLRTDFPDMLEELASGICVKGEAYDDR